jgi:hypothetical protein
MSEPSQAFGATLARAAGNSSPDGVSSEKHFAVSPIRHTVVFRLKCAAGSPEEGAFFKAAEALALLPQVQQFERLRQISKKNNYTFGLSMEFADETAYASYNSHPVHLSFLRDHWIPDVEDFMEIDYVALR